MSETCAVEWTPRGRFAHQDRSVIGRCVGELTDTALSPGSGLHHSQDQRNERHPDEVGQATSERAFAMAEQSRRTARAPDDAQHETETQ